MADYISILDKAISALGENTPANRIGIYEKARAAIERKLRAMDPLPSEEAISRQMEQLEAGIQQVESNYAKADIVDEAGVVEAPLVGEPEPAAAPERPVLPINVPAGFIDEPILIDGIGEKTAEMLAGAGITKISQIAEMSDAQLAAISAAIGSPGFEVTQEWKQQSLDMLNGALPRGKTNQDRLGKFQEEHTPAKAAETQPVSAEPAPAVSDPITAPVETTEPPIVSEPININPDPVAPAAEPDEDYDAFLKAFTNEGVTEKRPEVIPDPTPSNAGAIEIEPPMAVVPPTRPVTPTFEDDPVVGAVTSGLGQVQPPANVQTPQDPVVTAPAGQTRAPAPEFVSELENDFSPREQRPAPRRAHPALKQKKGAGRKIATGGLLVLLLGGAAYGAYHFRQPLMEMSEKGISAARALLNVDDQVETPTENTASNEAEKPDEPAKDASRLGNGEAVPAPAPVAVETVQPKPEAPEDAEVIEEQLVRNVDEEPAVEEVAEETPTVEPEASPEAEQPTENNTVTEENQSGQASSSETAVLSGEKSYLYEEALGNTGASRDEGNITWSLAEEPPEDGAEPEPVIKGMMEIPSRGLTMNLSIKRNLDAALSASHLIELVFTPLSEFSGGNIDNISRFVMKANEQARGESLVGIPVRIDVGFFWIALNNLDQAQKTNLSLLENGDWVDVPVTYVSGRRALLTFEKGVSGKEVFAKALADWKNR